MSFEHLLETYGYLAVLIGAFLEGETIVVLAGLAAKLGHLELDGVILAAFLGTTIGDQLYFFIGRRYGKAILLRNPSWHAKAHRVDTLMNRWDIGLVLGFRFLYGLRVVAALAFGMSSIDARKFIVLNLIGALLWALIMGSAGYLFGHGVEWLRGNPDEQWWVAAVILLALTVTLWWIRRPRISA
jgi:membrane protein DedA with SNARE-associated domain